MEIYNNIDGISDDTNSIIQIKIPDIWSDIYNYAKDGDLEKIKECYEIVIRDTNIFESEEQLNQIELFLHTITGICSKYNHINILDWLNNLSYFEIDSFQLFIVACENTNIEVIEWGIKNDFEFLPQHINYVIQNGYIDILEYLEETLSEEDIPILFSELFIKNAIIYKQNSIIDWYRDKGVPIDTNDYNNDEDEEKKE